MKKLLSLLVVLSVIEAGLWAGGKKEAPGSAQKFTLRISTVISTSDPMYKGYALLAENLGKRTNGAIQATVYPDAQLGQDEDVMEQALLGAGVPVSVFLKDSWPFLLTILSVVILLVIFPQLCLFLPNLLMPQ